MTQNMSVYTRLYTPREVRTERDLVMAIHAGGEIAVINMLPKFGKQYHHFFIMAAINYAADKMIKLLYNCGVQFPKDPEMLFRYAGWKNERSVMKFLMTIYPQFVPYNMGQLSQYIQNNNRDGFVSNYIYFTDECNDYIFKIIRDSKNMDILKIFNSIMIGMPIKHKNVYIKPAY